MASTGRLDDYLALACSTAPTARPEMTTLRSCSSIRREIGGATAWRLEVSIGSRATRVDGGHLMLHLGSTSIGFVLMLLCSHNTQGGELSNTAYDAEKASISTQYSRDLALCKTLSTNARTICISGVEGNKQVTEAKLEERDDPSTRHYWSVRMARAQADYDSRMQECGRLKEPARKQCVTQSKHRLLQAEADIRSSINSAGVKSTSEEK
jgi:hypothetical protein